MTQQNGQLAPGNAVPDGSQEIVARQSLTVLPDGTQPVPLASGAVSGVLGEGGAAIVYEIWNERLGVKRAVKMLRPNAMATTFERFSTEMRITAQLRHPNVIEIHSVGEWNHLPYIEMERLEGHSLDRILHRFGALPVPVVAAVGIMICRALKYTHSHDYAIGDKHYKGILHRDLKPANTMIAANGVVKLMDFGIATPANASMHTMEGTFVGSLQYLSPEQLEGNKASTASDMYAFGAMMYEMLTGVQAFAEKNMTKLISMRLKNEYKPLQDYRLRMPARFLRLVNACMAFDRERRVSQAGKALSELETILAKYTSLSAEEVVEYYLQRADEKRTVVFRRRFPFAAVAAGVIIAGGLGTGAYYLWSNREVLARRWFTPVTIHDSVVVTNVVSSTVAETVFVARETPRPRPATSQRRPAPLPVSVKPPPAPSPPPAAPRLEPSFIVKLTQQYGTNDLLAIMALEDKQQNHGSVLRVYDSLPPAQMRDKRAMLYKMRALQGMGNSARLGEYFSGVVVADAEYHLARAQYLYGRRAHREALAQLNLAATTQAELVDRRRVERDVVYFKALCLSGIFSNDATDVNRDNALNGWYDVKFALRNEQTHRYFNDANDQIRRLSVQTQGTE